MVPVMTPKLLIQYMSVIILFLVVLGSLLIAVGILHTNQTLESSADSIVALAVGYAMSVLGIQVGVDHATTISTNAENTKNAVNP